MTPDAVRATHPLGELVGATRLPDCSDDTFGI
jgi:hypothetical protein